MHRRPSTRRNQRKSSRLLWFGTFALSNIHHARITMMMMTMMIKHQKLPRVRTKSVHLPFVLPDPRLPSLFHSPQVNCKPIKLLVWRTISSCSSMFQSPPQLQAQSHPNVVVDFFEASILMMRTPTSRSQKHRSRFVIAHGIVLMVVACIHREAKETCVV
jgi:hypothetical protein